MMLQRHFRRIFNLPNRTGIKLCSRSRSHSRGNPDFTLATYLCTGDRSVMFYHISEQTGCRQSLQNCFVRMIQIFLQVANNCRDNPAGSASRRRNHQPAGGVFFGNSQSIRGQTTYGCHRRIHQSAPSKVDRSFAGNSQSSRNDTFPIDPAIDRSIHRFLDLTQIVPNPFPLAIFHIFPK